MEKKLECGFCFWTEHGNHGEVKREWSREWMMYIPVCRLHTLKPKKKEETL